MLSQSTSSPVFQLLCCKYYKILITTHYRNNFSFSINYNLTSSITMVVLLVPVFPEVSTSVVSRMTPLPLRECMAISVGEVPKVMLNCGGAPREDSYPPLKVHTSAWTGLVSTRISNASSEVPTR